MILFFSMLKYYIELINGEFDIYKNVVIGEFVYFLNCEYFLFVLFIIFISV